MPIDLDIKHGEYGKKKVEIKKESSNKIETEWKNKYTISIEPYGESNLFEKIIHKELYYEHQNSGKRDSTYLNFTSKNSNLKTRHYNFYDSNNKLDKVEIYVSIYKKEVPLVLVVTTKNSWYYDFTYLKSINKWTAISNTNRFGSDKLLDKLIEENNTQNNVITYRIDKTSTGSEYDGVTVVKEAHPSFDKYKHTPLNKAENTPAGTDSHTKPAYVLYKGRQIKLDTQSTFQGKEPKLENIQGKCYTEVTVFFFKSPDKKNPAKDLPIFFQLTEKVDQQGQSDNSPKKYHLQRTDSQAIKWKQITDPDLDNVITFLIEQKLDNAQRYNDRIVVSKTEETSFEKYTHKPSENNKEKVGMLLYNLNFLLFQSNESFTGNTKLDKLNGNKYSTLEVYYPRPSNNQLPLFLELKINSNDAQSTDYLLKRTDEKGLLWTQTNKIALADVVIYYLDKRVSGNETYNGISVKKEQNVGSFEKYKHTPVNGSSNKTGLLLYNGSSLVLEKNPSNSMEDILNDLENKKYKEVNVYYLTESNSYPPVFIELVVKPAESSQSDSSGSSKHHWLQKVNPNGLVWQQINDPKLSEFVYYKLEQKDKPGSYDGINVNKEYDNVSKMDKYTHTANEPVKKSLLLYNANLLVLQSNSSISQNNRLEKLEDKKFCNAVVYYRRSYNIEPPLFLELFERTEASRDSGSPDNCHCSDTTTNGNFKCYWLERVDTNGINWKQTTKRTDFDNLTNILMDINRNDKCSLIIRLNQKLSYDMKLFKYYETNTKGSQTYPPIQVKVQEKHTLGSNYKFYEHDFSGSSTVSESNNIVSIRLYFQNYEITFQTTSTRTNKLNHHPGQEKTNILTTYFNQGDDLPLMLKYDDCFYIPKSLKEYFIWEQVSGISNTNETENIKRKLNEINKGFNEIKLETTSGDSYGKIENSGKKVTLSVKSRITVTTETPSSLFKMVKHATTNTGPIGKITHSGSELNVLSGEQTSGNGTPMSTQITDDKYNTVTAYYHSSDSDLKTILLIEISSATSTTVRTGTPTKLFYQRIDKNDTLKWTKIESRVSEKFSNGSVLAEKINQIFYNFSNSVKIQLENKGNAHNSYKLELIKNGPTEGSEAPSDGNITVSEANTEFSLESNYKCLTHSINLGSNITGSQIGGLRFYFDTYEITFSNDTGILVIYLINYLQVNVYVYVHKESPLPLLVSYEKKYYGPSSRDKYFDKWEEKTGITAVGNDITQKLDEINRFLNNIELAETTNTKNGKKYGIINPGKDPPQEINENFYGRINVTVCVTTNYRKLTHSTINKFGIGSILFHGKPISTIQVQSNENEVSVYYDVNDIYFSRPLIISLSIQPQEEAQSSITKNWYIRKDLTGTKWEVDRERPGYQSNGGFMKDKLGELTSELFTTLTIDLERKEEYHKNFTINREQTYDSVIKIDKFGLCGGFDIRGYRCCEHKLYDYYNNINKSISPKNPTFILEPSVSGIKLGVYANNGKVSSPFTYKNTEANVNRSLYAYFDYPDEGEDIIPLVFNYDGKFFGPLRKDTYFSNWQNLGIDIVTRGAHYIDPSVKIKENLVNIYARLNEVDLSQRFSYGIPCCSTHPYYKKGNFSTKRVDVTMYSSTNYSMYIHKTVRKTNIGTIKHSNSIYNFNQHTEHIPGTQTINEVSVIYNGKNNTEKPVLVFLNEVSRYSGDSSTTYGYYYTENERGDMHIKYKFYPITGGCKIMGKLMGHNEGFFGLCNSDQTQVIDEILQKIFNSPMTLKSSSESEKDTSLCKGPIENEKDMASVCNKDDLGEESTDASSESSRDDQHLNGRADRSLLNGRSGSGLVHTPEQVPAAPQARTPELGRAQGPGGHTGLSTDDGQGQDDRPKASLGAPRSGAGGGHDAIGGSSGDVDAGTKPGEQGALGEDGKPGAGGSEGPQSTQLERTDLSTNSSASDTDHHTTTTGHEDQSNHQPHGDGGGGNDRQTGGDRGSEGSPSAQSSSGDGITAEKILEIVQQPYVYGSASAVAGVGVIGGIGAVVYKKCVAGTAVAAGKAAVEMRYFIVVKPISNTELKFKVYDIVNIIKSNIYKILYILI